MSGKAEIRNGKGKKSVGMKHEKMEKSNVDQNAARKEERKE